MSDFQAFFVRPALVVAGVTSPFVVALVAVRLWNSIDQMIEAWKDSREILRLRYLLDNAHVDWRSGGRPR